MPLVPTHKRENQMTDSITTIITQLERQKTAIDRALTALRNIDTEPAMAPQIDPAVSPRVPTRKRSAAVRRKMALAQQARWAKLKGEVEQPPAPTPAPPKAKRQISPEGLQRIIAATKKRWRLQKAAAKAALANASPKKAEVKKAVAPVAKAAKKVAPVKSAVKKAAVKKAAAAPALAMAQTAG